MRFRVVSLFPCARVRFRDIAFPPYSMPTRTENIVYKLYESGACLSNDVRDFARM